MSRRAAFGFDLIAPFYDFFTALLFAGRLSRAQSELIPELKSPRQVLVFGGGSGKILIDLLRHAGSAKFFYVDISRKMILRADRRLEDYSRRKESPPQVTFICGSLQDIPDLQFDLIVTPFVLDCFPLAALREIMRGLQAKLSPRGQWLFTDFHIPNGSMRLVAAFLTRTLYLVFNLFCALGIKRLPDFAEEFKALGLQKQTEKYFLRGLLVTRVYARL